MKRTLQSLLFIIICVVVVNAESYLYVYYKGNISYRESVDNIDSVAVISQRIMRFYGKNNTVLSSVTLTKVDSVVIEEFGNDGTPVADILDVRFNADGTASDVSPRHQSIQSFFINNLSTYYNPVYQRYVARFQNTWGEAPGGYYKYDYENNAEIRQALADGHTLEALFMVDYDTNTYPNYTCKFFTSHEAGGTGFSITNPSNGICMGVNSTNTNTGAYYWARSYMAPAARTFYHVVGVWDKNNNTCRLYVNGVLKGNTTTLGNFFFPAAGSCWFGIGCDANSGYGSDALNGEVAIARIYDKPLTETEVGLLWNKVKTMQKDNASTPLITRFDYLNDVSIKAGAKYDFYAKGFKAGDEIKLTSVTNTQKVFYTPVEQFTTDSAYFTIPSELTTDRYRIILQRGNETQDLGIVSLHIVKKMPAPSGAIGHRGFWDNASSAQNSRTALRKSIEANLYGSEIDVWLTSDNVIMVNHDATINGVTIQTSTYNNIKNQKLSNGELIPSLAELLDILKAASNNTKIIVEIKSHSSTARSVECADSVVAMINRYGLASKIDYQSFNLSVCQRLAVLCPNANVGLLYNASNPSPAQMKSYGINNMNYSPTVYYENSTLISQAQSLGIKVNAWTPGDKARFVDMINKGAATIATNNVPELLKVLKYYQRHAND